MSRDDFWDRRAREVSDPVLLGTVTDEAAVVRLRDRLEKAHLARALGLPDRELRVLEIGGGAGRIALWLAERTREVTLVDASAPQLDAARARARAIGVGNVETVHAKAEEYTPPRGAFDLIVFAGVLTHLSDDEVERLVDRIADGLAPGGRLAIKEPVTTDGKTVIDRREGYVARFRPRAFYADAFGRRLELVYQAPTLAHPIPSFLGGTNEAASRATGRTGALVERLTPLYVALDPYVARLERRVRETPGLSGLLAPVPVLQDLYVLRRRPDPRERPSAEPELSVVVIAYNEQECLRAVALEHLAALDAAGIDHELVLVDDGSTDGTLAIMRALEAEQGRVRVVSYAPNRGIGGALRAGFDAAVGRHVTWIPADGQIGPDVVLELHRRRHEAPMLTTVYTSRDDPLYRTVISRTLNAIIRARTGEVAKSGGNYLFERRCWREHAPAADDSMMISTAFRAALRAAGEEIVEVPIRARARVAGRSKVLNPSTIARTLAATLAMRRGG